MLVLIPLLALEGEGRFWDPLIVGFDQGRLSFGKAEKIVGMNVAAFPQSLGSQGIRPHYDVAEYQELVVTVAIALGLCPKPAESSPGGLQA